MREVVRGDAGGRQQGAVVVKVVACGSTTDEVSQSGV